MSAHTSQPHPPPNQKFGWFFALVFAFVSAYAYWKDANSWAIATIILAVLFAVVAVTVPKLLKPLNHIWFELGMLLGKIVSPIVLSVIFFLLITPVALVTRLFGRDALFIKSRVVSSYWVDRNPAGPEPNSFKNQF